MKQGWQYSLLKSIGVLLLVGGFVTLLSHRAGQLREGSASGLGLLLGACYWALRVSVAGSCS